MSINYTASNGIGYSVKHNNYTSETDLFYYTNGHKTNQFKCFRTGNYHDDEPNIKTFMVIKDAFKNGLDLTECKKALDNELERLGLVATCDFGTVGGLLIL